MHVYMHIRSIFAYGWKQHERNADQPTQQLCKQREPAGHVRKVGYVKSSPLLIRCNKIHRHKNTLTRRARGAKRKKEEDFQVLA